MTKDKSIGQDLPFPDRKKAQMTDCLERIKKQPREVWIVKMADRITNLQPPPFHWTKAKIKQYRDEVIEIHSALKDASPWMAERLKGKVEGYP